MRSHDALVLVTELARSSEAQTRKNAASALSIIGTPESTALLVNVALTDKDSDVRDRAEQELFLLGSKSNSGLKNVATELDTCLRDQMKRHDAYQLLGRLQRLGSPVKLPSLTLRDRFILAAGIRTRKAQRAYYYRPIFMGTVVGSACLLLFSLLVAPRVDVTSLVMLIVFGSCLAPQAGLLGTNRLWQWTPISLELDRLAGMLVDLWVALIGGSVMGAVLLVVFLLESLLSTGSTASVTGWKFVFFPLLGSVLLVATVRLGCALTFASVRQRGLDIVFTTFGGMAFGIAAVTLSIFLLRASGSNIASTAWLLLLPISAGLAAGVTGVDHTIKLAKKPLFGRVTSIAVGVLAVVVVLCAVLAAWPSSTAHTVTPVSIPDSSPSAVLGSPKKIPLTTGNVQDKEMVDRPSRLVAAIVGPDISKFRLYITGGLPPIIGSSSTASTFILPPSITVLALGSTEASKIEPEALLGMAARRLIARLRRTEVPAADNTLEITISAPDVSSTKPPQLNTFCWQGTLKGYASDPSIREACEKAVSESNGAVEYRDSRGVNRALNGEFDLAIADFRAFVSANEKSTNPLDQSRVRERADWIKQLQAHKNPFTAEELSHLLPE